MTTSTVTLPFTIKADGKNFFSVQETRKQYAGTINIGKTTSKNGSVLAIMASESTSFITMLHNVEDVNSAYLAVSSLHYLQTEWIIFRDGLRIFHSGAVSLPAMTERLQNAIKDTAALFNKGDGTDLEPMYRIFGELPKHASQLLGFRTGRDVFGFIQALRWTETVLRTLAPLEGYQNIVAVVSMLSAAARQLDMYDGVGGVGLARNGFITDNSHLGTGYASFRPTNERAAAYVTSAAGHPAVGSTFNQPVIMPSFSHRASMESDPEAWARLGETLAASSTPVKAEPTSTPVDKPVDQAD